MEDQSLSENSWPPWLYDLYRAFAWPAFVMVFVLLFLTVIILWSRLPYIPRENGTEILYVRPWVYSVLKISAMILPLVLMALGVMSYSLSRLYHLSVSISQSVYIYSQGKSYHICFLPFLYCNYVISIHNRYVPNELSTYILAHIL